jgi:hypothetical protein
MLRKDLQYAAQVANNKQVDVGRIPTTAKPKYL